MVTTIQQTTPHLHSLRFDEEKETASVAQSFQTHCPRRRDTLPFQDVLWNFEIGCDSRIRTCVARVRAESTRPLYDVAVEGVGLAPTVMLASKARAVAAVPTLNEHFIGPAGLEPA